MKKLVDGWKWLFAVYGALFWDVFWDVNGAILVLLGIALLLMRGFLFVLQREEDKIEDRRLVMLDKWRKEKPRMMPPRELINPTDIND